VENQGNSAHLAGIIPARWESSRFPGKPLHLLAGKPLLQHVYDRALECEQLDEVAIATDDARIREAAESWGAQVIMTSSDHPTGTDRLAEAV
jgi:3-deoxy-manno-octulosonate cytidylyltransferase (CMP-KDO synthetase)